MKITLVKSPIGFDRKQAATVQGMGLRRIGHSVELVDTPATRGMILKVRHLVTVRSNSDIELMDSEQPPSPQGAKHSKKRVGRGQGSGNGEQAGPRPQGREVAFGLQAQARVRRRPDAAAPARAEARVPQPVPRRVRGREPRHARRSGSTPAPRSRRSCCASTAWSGAPGRVKMLARGDISKALTIRAHKFSGKAAEKIAAAGGTAEVLA